MSFALSNASKRELTKTEAIYIKMKLITLFVMLVMLISFIPAISAAEQRPVYIISDHINSPAQDNVRINTIVKTLKDAGVKNVYNYGVGTNNYAILQKTPSNAIIIQIMGGTCAATIYSMTMENYYKNLKGNRIVYPVWVSPATDISTISWLGRSRDDGGHGSFTGISNPAQKLKANGYDWTYWRTNTDLQKINIDITKKAGVVVKKPEPVEKEAPPLLNLLPFLINLNMG
jgi:hypothetical protein